MPDNKARRGPSDRRQVAGRETYEAGYFARKTGLPLPEVRALIKRVGNGRTKLMEAFRKLKK